MPAPAKATPAGFQRPLSFNWRFCTLTFGWRRSDVSFQVTNVPIPASPTAISMGTT